MFNARRVLMLCLTLLASGCSPGEPATDPTARDVTWETEGPTPAMAPPVTTPAAPADAGASVLIDDDVGEYRRKSPEGVMTLTREGDLYRVRLHGDAPDRGVALPAPCTLVGRGEMIDGVLQATLFPYSDDDYSITESDVAEIKGMIILVTQGPYEFEVIERYSDDVCGLGSNLDGLYVATKR